MQESDEVMLRTLKACRGTLLALLFLQLLAPAANGEPGEILLRAGVISLGHIQGRMGPIAASADGARLYVAADVHPNVVMAIDGKGGKEIGRAVEGMSEPGNGAAFAPDCDRLIIANGADRISLYESNLALAGVVKDLFKANCVRYDPVSKLAYVGHSDVNGLQNGIGVVDPRKAHNDGDIAVEGYPQGFALETKGNRIFVNIPRTQQIAVIDRQKRAVVGIWPLQDPRWSFPLNFAMALDEEHHRLFIGCRNPAKLVVIDTDTGKIVSTIDCCPNVRDLSYDAQRKRIYASGDEYVSVISQADPNTYKIAGFVTTNSRGNTSLFVPATRKLYVVTEEPKSEVTKIMVFDCGTNGAPTTAPAANAGN